MLETLINIDRKIFVFINQTLSNSVFDVIMPFWRDAKVWTPLYILILVIATKEFKKNVWLWFLFGVLTVIITDGCSSHLIKPFVQRVRPYDDVVFKSQVHLLLNSIDRGFSFTSSHATNHFGIALFFINTVNSLKKYKYFFLAWAFIVCIAQIYVGVHYPFDVLCGSILGTFLGKFTSYWFKKAQTFANSKKH